MQLARRAGLTVLATGRAGDEAFLRGLGADYVIDYRAVDIAEETPRLVPGGVDVVFDMVHAGPALTATAAAARPGGRLVSPLGGPPVFDRDVTALYGGTRATEGRLASLADRAVKGELRIPIDADYPFVEARQALLDFAGRHVKGKITVTF